MMATAVIAKCPECAADVKLGADVEKGEIVPCADCGIQYPSWVMEFDHVRGEKRFNVSAAPTFSLDALLAEAAKCEIVCSNCHQARTRQRSSRAPIAQSG